MEKNRIDDIEFMNLYIKAIKQKITLQQFAESLGVSYMRVMQRKKKIAELTGKKLPPLSRPNKMSTVNLAKLEKLVNNSYAQAKSQYAQK